MALPSVWGRGLLTRRSDVPVRIRAAGNIGLAAESPGDIWQHLAVYHGKEESVLCKLV
jgi:hypothetical protein